MIGLAGRATMPQVRAIAAYRLESLGRLLGQRSGDTSEVAHRQALVRDITRFLEQPGDATAPPATPAAPPGAPIGQPAMDWLQALEPACSYLEW